MYECVQASSILHQAILLPSARELQSVSSKRQSKSRFDVEKDCLRYLLFPSFLLLFCSLSSWPPSISNLPSLCRPCPMIGNSSAYSRRTFKSFHNNSGTSGQHTSHWTPSGCARSKPPFFPCLCPRSGLPLCHESDAGYVPL